ncbi:hypothetical protein GCM10010371_16590 [Streptomyces subrutilus]|uniref:Uncharacterized protein n=1 Tax=Streptomyces subrutilus TaxID=36818 RepID=A0A918QKX7_9ACTN|nr:hypothetical protein GCM10010371_16590 [Streptomyces subrutilus]
MPEASAPAPPACAAMVEKVRSPLPTASRIAREWDASGNSPGSDGAPATTSGANGLDTASRGKSWRPIPGRQD